MLSERDIEQAHPDAFDFVFGNLPAAKRAEFNRHLIGCRYCQAVVDEYSEIGGIIKQLPPHVEPPAELEDRMVAAMVAALAEQKAKPDAGADAEDQAATRVYPIPEPSLRAQPPAEPETQAPAEAAARASPAEPQARPVVTRLPVWRRPEAAWPLLPPPPLPSSLAAIVVPLSLGSASRRPATVVIPLHATTAAKLSGVGAATGQATARQDASGSWNITMTVHHLKNFEDAKWYECWYVGTAAPASGTGWHVPRLR